MNAWYMLAAYVGAILICLALCAVSLAVMMHGIVKQRRLGGRLAFLIAAGAVTAAVLLFTIRTRPTTDSTIGLFPEALCRIS